MAAITIKDMCVSYNKGKTYVLDKLNLDIKDGEFCVFLGPSGCGKSTAMYSIAGLLEPFSGQIYFGDTLMTETGAQHRYGVPGIRPVSQHDRAGEHGLRPEDQEGSEG